MPRVTGVSAVDSDPYHWRLPFYLTPWNPRPFTNRHGTGAAWLNFGVHPGRQTGPNVTVRGWGSLRGWDWADCSPDSLQWKLRERRAEAWKPMHVSFHSSVMKAQGHWLNCSSLRNEAQLGSCVSTTRRRGGLWHSAAGRRLFTGANVW